MRMIANYEANGRVIDWRAYFSGGYYVFASLDSTQTFLQQQPANAAPLFCRADQQSQGHGQRDAHWQSPPEQLYCSLRVALALPLSALAGLTQLVALSIAQALDPEHQFLRLKWPNDLFTQRGKCGGILIDAQAWRQYSLVTIGIGLNLTPDAAFAHLSEHISLSAEDALDAFMPTLITGLSDWQSRPYLPIDHAWQYYDRHHQHTVSLDNGTRGKVLGIDQHGALIIADAQQLHFHTQVRIRS